MNPHQQNKVDINSLSPEEQRLLRLYGKMPTKKDVLQNKLKERKYFDSGDYALSKAGKASDVGVTNIGSRHPVPENIPHLTSTSPGANNSANNGSVSSQGGQQIPGSISGHPGSTGFQGRGSIKEGGSYLHRGTSISEGEAGSRLASGSVQGEKELSVSPPAAREGVPIRR
ncbi:Endosulphine [Penicillium verrucosum]|uniref:Endosulphine n=1 Tax=Penicillium verrucosum TaxID=60171 RepID=UPI00254549CC|nr:Endosulphine [Penicillium verrucosum]KAJ5923013.1 Endosulphine [Penicillium verrucosum]